MFIILMALVRFPFSKFNSEIKLNLIAGMSVDFTAHVSYHYQVGISVKNDIPNPIEICRGKTNHNVLSY